MFEPPVRPPGEPPVRRQLSVDYSEPEPTDPVTFSVICRPASGMGLAEFRATLHGVERERLQDFESARLRGLATETPRKSEIEALLPSDATLAAVSAELRLQEFEVFDELTGVGVVFARGTVARFEQVFRTKLVKMTRREAGGFERETTAIVLPDGATPPSAEAVPGALLVTITEPPLPAVPTGSGVAASAYCLSLPEDVANVTNAGVVHQLPAPGATQGTGIGVKAAVVDTGFAYHPYFRHRGYHISRIAASDTRHPGIDGDNHGTFVLANLLACAPGAHAYGVKFEDINIGFATAVLIPGIRIISLSWMFEIRAELLPDWVLTLEFLVAIAVQQMGIVVIVAAGNDAAETTPARLPWVISVGGISVVDSAWSMMTWPSSTSFTSVAFPQRSVPDLCGVASEIDLPLPPARDLCMEGGTSCATPQVAGVAALLLQKNPTLTPFEVKSLLMLGARDIASGTSFTGASARPGWDPATGYGFVNALTSWNLVP